MITEVSYNNDVNPMDWAYLRVKRNCPFLKSNEPTPQSQSGRETDELCNCCDPERNFIQLALADVANTDTDRNDFFGWYFEVPVSGSTLTHILQKNVGGSWINVITLNSTYGTIYNPGVFTSYPLWAGIRLSWRAVLIVHDEGSYRIRTNITSIGTTSTYSPVFCLKQYSIYSADKTVVFKWNNNGFITSSDDDPTLIEYGNTNLQQMVRLTGNFRYDKDEQEVVDVSYYNGNFLEIERIRDKTNYKYKFQSGYYPDWIHSMLKNIAFKSNSLTVTNYNRLSKHNYVDKAIVKEANGYSPKMDNTYKKWYNVEVDFRDKYDDLGFSKNCLEDGNNPLSVTIVDENGNIITTVPNGGTYVDSAGGTPANVSNSDDSYDVSVPCGGNLELPDTTVNVYVNGVLNQTTTIVTLGNETINIYP